MSASGLQDGQRKEYKHAVWFLFHVALLGIVLIDEIATRLAEVLHDSCI